MQATATKDLIAALNDFSSAVPSKHEELAKVLQAYGVKATPATMVEGPRVTRYTFEVEAGTRVSRYLKLGPELTIALGAPSAVSVVPNVPGTPWFAVDVPNSEFETVEAQKLWATETKAKIPLFIGVDVAGSPLVYDLAAAPHLMVAGGTGSGKSVNLHAMLCGLLERFSHEELRFAMIDLKGVELNVYRGAPHLIGDVVTNSLDAIRLLQQLERVMKARYAALAKEGYQNIYDMNKAMAAQGYGAVAPVVCVIDELADLLEGNLAGVATQCLGELLRKCRGAGIHIIASTQRPCAKTVASVIKTNITAAVAFKTKTPADSRIILNSAGAERLAGAGDGLISYPGAAEPETRFQGAYISRSAIEEIVQRKIKRRKA